VRESRLSAEVLTAVSGGDLAFERALLSRFLSCIDVDASQLDSAIRERATGRIEAIAHRVQGRCKALGAMTLGEAAECLERAASRGDWRDILEAHERGRQELLQLRREIDRRLSIGRGLP
jgi:HPt (histidine-containing phosphotransfer) domain-containing protein